MDTVKSSKLTALISKLTVAANKAVKKTRERNGSQKHYPEAKFNTSLRFHLKEQNLHAAKLTT
jgi:hypothetical protein